MKSLATLRKNKKGFTLVEVIVVLVILAILAAILVPSLTGYIDRANERAVIAETRACVMAAQTLASEDYAFNRTGENVTCDADGVEGLAEVTGSVDSVTPTSGKIEGLTYTNYGKTCVYDPDATEIYSVS